MDLPWHATSFGAALLSAAAFGALGIVLILAGYFLFDLITPRIDLQKELAENRNLAVAIVTAAILLGVAIVTAAAIIG